LDVRFGAGAVPADVLELTDLCVKHNICDLYLWLANRFPGNFVERELAVRQKAAAIGLIQQGLKEMDLDLEDIAGLGFGGNRGGGGGSNFRKALAAQGKGGKGVAGKGASKGPSAFDSARPGKGAAGKGKSSNKGLFSKGPWKGSGGGGGSSRAAADLDRAVGGAKAQG
jgi:hypothetical protein